MSAGLEKTAHRPWRLPAGRWIMSQIWHDLLFAHWPVSIAMLREQIPPRLEIDAFEGEAWIGVVPFRMSGVRLRGTPTLPWLSAFPELNVRTYVVADGKPGVWFFSLDAANSVAVAVARAWFRLPYFRARMACEEHENWIHYRSERAHRGASPAVLDTRYRPVGKPFAPQRGTLEHFLTERYCLYAADLRRNILLSEIHHAPWSLQVAEAQFVRNTMPQAAGFSLPSRRPLLHFAKRQDVVVWRPERLTS